MPAEVTNISVQSESTNVQDVGLRVGIETAPRRSPSGDSCSTLAPFQMATHRLP